MASNDLWKAERTVYKVSRFLGDLAAASEGPDKLMKRVARRKATRTGFRLIDKLFK